MDLRRLEQEQVRLAKKVIARDDFRDINTIAGCDIAYTNSTIICTIIVMDYPSLNIREIKTQAGGAKVPYIPGFLSYREAPMIIETYHELELEPDLVMVDGNGRLHPRRMGLASAVGLSLDKPSIGVAKRLLLGDVRDGFVYDDQEKLAVAMVTKDKAKPIYVSPGHRISLTKAAEIAHKCLTEHKLPEPLHQAHKMANKARRKLKE